MVGFSIHCFYQAVKMKGKGLGELGVFSRGVIMMNCQYEVDGVVLGSRNLLSR